MTHVYVCESCGAVYGDEPKECASCHVAGEQMREEVVRDA